LQNIVILQYMVAISMIFMRYIVEIYHFATAPFFLELLTIYYKIDTIYPI